MNCYDCATQDHLARPAVGICHDCGAAVCEHHAVTRERHLTSTMPMLRDVPIDPPARTLRCTTCDAAYAAKHGQHDHATTRTRGTRARSGH